MHNVWARWVSYLHKTHTTPKYPLLSRFSPPHQPASRARSPAAQKSAQMNTNHLSLLTSLNQRNFLLKTRPCSGGLLQAHRSCSFKRSPELCRMTGTAPTRGLTKGWVFQSQWNILYIHTPICLPPSLPHSLSPSLPQSLTPSVPHSLPHSLSPSLPKYPHSPQSLPFLDCSLDNSLSPLCSVSWTHPLMVPVSA